MNKYIPILDAEASVHRGRIMFALLGMATHLRQVEQRQPTLWQGARLKDARA